MKIKLAREWVLGARIDGGGFGEVYEATSLDASVGRCVLKLVPKKPGAQRELLFVNIAGARNTIPIIDSGETATHWVIAMPRAKKSLREHMKGVAAPLDAAEAISILIDIATALLDLDGKVVHRDLKPENVLLLNNKWCLADFGISRYAEATTAVDTHKYALSPPYAAPERFRSERATGATDIYALGIIGFELLSGARPFDGPDIRDQHLNANPAALNGVPTALAAVIAQCLYKSTGSRPGPQQVLAALQSAANAPSSAGRAQLQQANLQAVVRQSEAAREKSAKRSESERRQGLFRDAVTSLKQIGEQLSTSVAEDAPAARIIQADENGGWSIALTGARLEVKGAMLAPADPWGGWTPPSFDVIAYASIAVHAQRNRFGYDGRSHSLWFGDVGEVGRYGWFETAFMFMPLTNQSSSIAPFSMDLGEGAAKALWTGMAEYQLAWPFMPLSLADLSEFLDRWIGWFASVSQGQLSYPSTMPERHAEGSWRR